MIENRATQALPASAGVIYVTYDGLLDPLGASQILPYLRGIAAHPRGVTVLSFEKSFRLAGRPSLGRELDRLNIGWVPLRFTARYGALGKLWDLARMYVVALWLAWRRGARIVHARGHAAAQAGLLVKHLMGGRLIFDFRGLWADERVDKGGWDLSRRLHRWQYRHYKRVEARLLRECDQIVVLTEAVVSEVLRLGVPDRGRVTVIPCCADFDHFRLADRTARAAARAECGIAAEALVLGYLGSVGRMYLSDRFLQLAALAVVHHPELHLLVLTPDPALFMRDIDALTPALAPRVHCRSATRVEVARLLPAMDVLVSFIAPSYARMAASPTKMAEAFAEGIAVIANQGTGDVVPIMARLDGGAIIDAADASALAHVAANLPAIIAKGGTRLRDAARAELGLEVAQARYAHVYAQASSQQQAPC